MAVRTILHYPDKRLRLPTAEVESFDQDLRALIEDMAETMYAAPGVGLAAPQIGVAKRIFVVDTAAGEDEPSDFRVFINPEIISGSGEVLWEEGCLSFPGVREDIKRFEKVRARAQDVDGQTFEVDADGLLAIAIQHEKDHLDGVLMIDKVGALKKRMIHRTLSKRASG